MLYIIRHGETVWNTEGRIQGHQDSPLTTNGMMQAEHYAKILTHHIDKNNNIEHNIADFDFVVSPLQRTKHTAKIILNSLDLKKDIILEPLAKEQYNGIFEGKPYGSSEEYYSKQKDQWNYRYSDEESREMFYNRIDKLFDKYKDKKTILITHSCVSLYLRAIIGKTNKDFHEMIEKHDWQKQDEIFLVKNGSDINKLKL